MSCKITNMADFRLQSPISHICHEKISMCINKVAEATAKQITVDVTVSVELHLIFYVTYFDKLFKMFFQKL